MKILSIDTAHNFCSVALSEGGVLIAAKTNNEASRQAELLFSIIDDVLNECGTTYANLDAIAVNIGPGSFTGVRIGLAAARGIALAAKIPVIAVDSFEAMLYSPDFIKSQLTCANSLVVFDAKRGQVYAQFFENSIAGESLLLDYANIDQIINNKNDFIIIGDGANLIESFLQNKGLTYSIISELHLPDAIMLAHAAFNKITKGNLKDNIAPLYIRPPDAKLPQKK